jgi:hypothetical protein
MPAKEKDSDPKKSRTEKKGPKPIHSNKVEAHKGIPESWLEARAKRNECKHCGFSKHDQWFFCKNPIKASSIRRNKKHKEKEEESCLCRVRIGDRVWINEEVIESQKLSERIRFCWKESGFNARNEVLLEGIRFCWKESGFAGKNQVLLERIRFCWKKSGFMRGNQVFWMSCEYGVMALLR